MTANEDDFWNESSSSRLNFFDDEDSVILETDTFTSTVQENITLPIHSIVSNKCLKIILDETDCTVEHVVTPVEDTVRHMFFAQNLVLTTYRTLEGKLQLLDAAVDIGDGNIIITIILFLSKTLNNNIFFTQLSKRKVAVRHYANYLIEKNSLQDLADLYMATGNISNVKDIYSLLAKDTSNQNVLHKKLEQFNIHHSHNLLNADDRLEIQDNLALLDLNIKNKHTNRSLIDQLIFFCEKQTGNDVINDFKKQFKVDNFQYEWVLMSVLCKMENWDKLLGTFIKNIWMMKKRALKSVIRSDLFVIGVGRHNPPEYVTEQFLSCIGDVSRALYLAEKLKNYVYVVDYYVEQKDRTSLLQYMERVGPGSSVMLAIQHSLNNPDIKWKN